MLRSGKPKDYSNLVEDPYFFMMLSRLLGVAELSGDLLTNQESPDVKQIGANLMRAVSWFYETVPGREVKK